MSMILAWDWVQIRNEKFTLLLNKFLPNEVFFISTEMYDVSWYDILYDASRIIMLTITLEIFTVLYVFVAKS